MPKRTDIQSVLIIGAGPIVIGQACEFDYSGAQACKALREEGYRVILVNSNPATIMTDPETADAVYIEPIEWRIVEQIIANERPDVLLPTMGGQTALNCALDLAREGVLAKYGVEMIGATREAIDMAEDREQFRNAMLDIGLEVPGAAIAHSMEEALQQQASIGYPTIIRTSFTMGGSCHQPPRSCSRSRCWGGKSSRWKWSAITRTTASLSVPSKISIRWACTPEIPSQSPRLKP
jgi:carbamoyl-phosphate synthase large subunit